MVNKLEIEGTRAVSRVRSVFSQLVACMSPNLLLMDLGMAIGFPTIALPELLNADQGLSLDDHQASWFGSVAFLCQPLGAVFSGPLVDFFGRKRATFMVNVPHTIAWILMYYAYSVPALFVANALLGLGTGIMEAPINSYVGEVSEPSVRGSMSTLTQLFCASGIFIVYFLGIAVPWRQAALICLAVPLASMLLVLLVPETPIWLLSKGREKEALKSLCYLRGWTTPDNVKEEFDKLVEYTKTLMECAICEKEERSREECEHVQMNVFKRFILKFRYVMLCKETLRPFSLVMAYFFFLTMSGLMPMRPNMVNVCRAFGMAQDGKDITVVVGVITILASLVVVLCIKVMGKRKLAVMSMFGIFLFTGSMSIYANQNLDNSVFSYDIKTFPTETSYVPLALFYLMTIFTGFAIPWVLLAEIFPFRSRGTAQGFAAAGNYIITFFASKTFINLETNIHLWGTFGVYALFALAGTVYLYFFLPETEGKTLAEIEGYYKGKCRTFADDRFINILRKRNNIA